MLLSSFGLASIVLASTALAATKPNSWEVNFYSSSDCSAQSLTSTHTGNEFYVRTYS